MLGAPSKPRKPMPTRSRPSVRARCCLWSGSGAVCGGAGGPAGCPMVARVGFAGCQDGVQWPSRARPSVGAPAGRGGDTLPQNPGQDRQPTRWPDRHGRRREKHPRRSYQLLCRKLSRANHCTLTTVTINDHPLSGKEIRALRQLRRENMETRYVFITERGGPTTTAGFLKMIARTGEAAKLPFPVSLR
jgi:hypothetical protein